MKYEFGETESNYICIGFGEIITFYYLEDRKSWVCGRYIFIEDFEMKGK